MTHGGGRNDVGEAKRISVDVQVAWDHLDNAPQAVRRALHEAMLPWSPIHCVRLYNKIVVAHGVAVADEVTVGRIRAADAAERQRFADAFEKQFGTPYPARAARSTVQRYARRTR
jgi:transposase-like protein